MFISNQQVLMDDQDLSQVAGTYYSTNVFDRGANLTPMHGAAALNYDWGPGKQIPFDCLITETFTSGGAATVAFTIQMDTVEGFGSPTDVVTSATFALADLNAGVDVFSMLHLPLGITERYVRIKIVIATATTTAGTVTCMLASGGRRTNIPARV